MLKRLTVTLIVAVATGLPTAVAVAATAGASNAAPTIHEHFTVLRCSGSPGHRSTIQLEGCAEHHLLRTDGRIDHLYRTIYGALPTARGREDFLAASSDWLRYRNASCATAAGGVQGGSEAPVVTVQCDVTLDSEHVTDLRRLMRDVRAE
jgi:uncharacterized protein YecT (DUF1311 family)